MWLDRALLYLGVGSGDADEGMKQLFDSCREEIEEKIHPRFLHERCRLSHLPLRIDDLSLSLAYPQLEQLFAGCRECEIVAVTLGVEAERLIRYCSFIDMARMSMMDAMLSAYVEEYCDAKENELDLGIRTMRFCPGYGSVPLSLNEDIGNRLSLQKRIGIDVKKGGSLLPQKSMIALIGIGAQGKKISCFQCRMQDDCEWKRRGKTCYLTD